jgi:predicted transcriptional regulator
MCHCPPRAVREFYPHVFSPIVDREAVARTQVEAIAANLYDGKVASVVLSMVERVNLTKKDRAIIESILEKLD